MNTRKSLADAPNYTALSVSLNSDNSCFAVATEQGFRICKADTCDVLAARDDLDGGIGMAEMAGRTNYVALVGGGARPKFPYNNVVIWDESKQKKVISLSFRTAVQRVRFSKEYLAVALLNSVVLYKFVNPPQELATFETSNNPFGLIALGKCIMAFPGRTPGHVQMVELETRNVSIVPAHTSPLRALSLSLDDATLATASETGTLIRVWDASSCARLMELRRGVDAAAIFALAISPDGGFLAVTADTGTVHIFDLPKQSSDSKRSDQDNWEDLQTEFSSPGSPRTFNNQKYGFLSKLPLMPRVVTDTYSFATARFEVGSDPNRASSAGRSPSRNAPIPGVPGGRPTKGVTGWLNDSSFVVISAGNDSRWEQFSVSRPDAEGRRFCTRDGWRRYLPVE